MTNAAAFPPPEPWSSSARSAPILVAGVLALNVQLCLAGAVISAIAVLLHVVLTIAGSDVEREAALRFAIRAIRKEACSLSAFLSLATRARFTPTPVPG
jgi:hypothetical protein